MQTQLKTLRHTLYQVIYQAHTPAGRNSRTENAKRD